MIGRRHREPADRQLIRWRAQAAVLLFAVLAALPGTIRADEATRLETPFFAREVADGRLPPLTERLPQSPRVIDPREAGGTLGRHGGAMRWLMGKPKDLRMVAYYGYARLIGYDRFYSLEPDILDRYTQTGKKQFTFHLRPGHKWSDGTPFTAEDFRYVWEDVYNDPRIGKGLPRSMLVDGRPPLFFQKTIESLDFPKELCARKVAVQDADRVVHVDGRDQLVASIANGLHMTGRHKPRRAN